jgi:hypothetical protein
MTWTSVRGIRPSGRSQRHRRRLRRAGGGARRGCPAAQRLYSGNCQPGERPCVYLKMRSSFSPRQLTLFPLALLLALAVAAPSSARNRSRTPSGNSAISQYLESIPGAGGGSPTNTIQPSNESHSSPSAGGGSYSAHSSLSARRLAALGADGAAVSSLVGATAPPSRSGIGAPGSAGTGRNPGGTLGVGAPPRGAFSPSTSSAGGGGVGVVLPVLMGLSLIGTIALAILRRRHAT